MVNTRRLGTSIKSDALTVHKCTSCASLCCPAGRSQSKAWQVTSAPLPCLSESPAQPRSAACHAIHTLSKASGCAPKERSSGHRASLKQTANVNATMERLVCESLCHPVSLCILHSVLQGHSCCKIAHSAHSTCGIDLGYSLDTPQSCGLSIIGFLRGGSGGSVHSHSPTVI